MDAPDARQQGGVRHPRTAMDAEGIAHVVRVVVENDHIKGRGRQAAAQAAQESAALSFEPQPQPDEEFNIQHLDDYDDESKSAVLKKEIKDFSRTNPDVVAQLIRSMMKNGE